MRNWLLVFLFYKMGLILASQENGVCPQPDGKLQCCANFRRLFNGTCEACPAGQYGVNCSQPCPLGYFGLNCKYVCNCSTVERCYPDEGCLPVIINPRDEDTEKKENVTDSVLKDTLLKQSPVPENAPAVGFPVPMAIFIIILSLCLTLVVVLFIIRQMVNRGRESRFRGLYPVNDSQSNQSNAELLAPSTSGHGEDSTYTEIRVSKLFVGPEDSANSKQCCGGPRDMRSSNHYSQFKTRQSNIYDKLALRQNSREHNSLGRGNNKHGVQDPDQYVTLSNGTNCACVKTDKVVEPNSNETTWNDEKSKMSKNSCGKNEENMTPDCQDIECKNVPELCRIDELGENGNLHVNMKVTGESRQVNACTVNEEKEQSDRPETQGEYYTLTKDYTA